MHAGYKPMIYLTQIVLLKVKKGPGTESEHAQVDSRTFKLGRYKGHRRLGNTLRRNPITTNSGDLPRLMGMLDTI